MMTGESLSARSRAILRTSARAPLLAALLASAAVSRGEAQASGSSILTRDSVRAQVVDTVKVLGRIDDLIGSAHSASEGRIGAVDLRQRPITR